MSAAPSYAQGQTDTPLLEETIGANLERTVSKFGEHDALVDVPSGRRWTYAEFDADVNRLAKGLLGIGLEVGDRVGIWSPNCPEWTLLQYATAKVGVVLVNVNPAYRTHELSYALQQSGLRLLVSAESFKGSDYRAMVEEVVAAGDAGSLERTVHIGTDEWEALLADGEGLPEDAVAERMSTRYLGENGPKYLAPTLDKPRWLYRLVPVTMQTWQGQDWAGRYK